MDIGGINLNGVVISSLTSDFQYLTLQEQSVAVVGPNGVGKTNLLKSFQNAFCGIEDAENVFAVSLDISIPLNFENWRGVHADPGIFKSLENALTAKLGNITYSGKVSSSKKFSEMLNARWSEVTVQSLVEARRGALEKISTQNKEEALWNWAKGYFENSRSSEYLQWVHSLIDSFEGIPIKNCFLVTPVGVLDKPRWRFDLLIKKSLNTAEEEDDFHKLAQIMVWPMTIAEASKFHGYFGKSFPDPDEVMVQNQFVQFLNDEMWIGMNVGFSDSPLGIDLVDPDNLDLGDLEKQTREYIQKFFTFTKNKELAEKLLSWDLSGSNKQPRIATGQKPFNPFTSDGTISEEFRIFLESLSRLMSDLMSDFLAESPKIEVTTNRRETWVTDGIVRLQASDGLLTIPLNLLSITQQRWAKLAIYCSLHSFGQLIIFIDEPERGLQRKLDKAILSNLQLSESNVPRFIATHSAQIIGRCETAILIKKCSDGTREVQKIIGSLLSYLTDLDITEEEYFQSKRVLILTEGLIDKEMLEGFAGERFQSNGIEVLHGAGLDSWQAYFDSRIFGKMSGIKVVFWADSLDIDKLNSILDRVISENIPKKAINFFLTKEIETAINDRWHRNYIKTLAAILSENLISENKRIMVESTGDYDCIMWLTPQILGLSADITWDQIRHDAEQYPGYSSNVSTGVKFKNYVKLLLKRRGISDGLNSGRLKQICLDLQLSGQVPEKLENKIQNIINFAVHDT